jgi:hypothetical protein
MHRTYCLHNLSARSQHATADDARAALKSMLNRLERLRPLVQRKRAVVLYDSMLEAQSIEQSNRNILGLVNTLPRDDRVRWFIAVKNHADSASPAVVPVTVTDVPDRRSELPGVAPEEFVSEQNSWLSFNGTTVFDSPQIEVKRTAEMLVKAIPNVVDLPSLERDWPVYVRSPKHRIEEYTQGGMIVSAMDLSDVDAHQALLVSLEAEGGRYAFVRGKFYRFVATGGIAAPPTFHGFRVRDFDVPAEVRQYLS